MSSTTYNPPNRFEPTQLTWEGPAPGLRYVAIEDHAKSILSENTSPDLPFSWSINPYRGCFHGCAYCYARPTHEYLGLGAGTDFQSRILYKPRAHALLEHALERPKWQGELILFSGNTDCYQPLESRLALTRKCLEVCSRYRNPVGIITRSTLIARDIDLLQELGENASVSVTISIPFHDPGLCRLIEPGAPPPKRRYETIEILARAGIPVGVNVAPLIPGLNDNQVVDILKAAHAAGARWASTILVRLPGSVAPYFQKRLQETMPDRASTVLGRIRRARGGNLSDSQFGSRMKGQGPEWESTKRLFDITRSRLGFGPMPATVSGTFRRPGRGKQVELFPPRAPAGMPETG